MIDANSNTKAEYTVVTYDAFGGNRQVVLRTEWYGEAYAKFTELRNDHSGPESVVIGVEFTSV